MKNLILLLTLLISIPSLASLTNPTILYIGDSHSITELGDTINIALSKIAEHVIMESSCGSTSNTWLFKSEHVSPLCWWKKDKTSEVRTNTHQTPKFSDEKLKYTPDVVIIQLGTNMTASENPYYFRESIDQLMKEAKTDNSECIWIGPPDANSKIITKERLAIVNNMIKELAEVNNCYYIDSLQLTSYPIDNPEGIHYPPHLSVEWGEKLNVIIKNRLSAINYLNLFGIFGCGSDWHAFQTRFKYYFLRNENC